MIERLLFAGARLFNKILNSAALSCEHALCTGQPGVAGGERRKPGFSQRLLHSSYYKFSSFARL